MEYKIKNLSEHEKKELLNAVVEIINREGPMYVRALYETLRRDHNISLFGEKITDLLKEDPRFTMKGTYQEQIALSDGTKNEEKTSSSMYSLCKSILDYNENHMKYSDDDRKFLCSRLKESGFEEKDLVSDVYMRFEEGINEVLLKYA